MTSPTPGADVRVRELAAEFIAAIEAHLRAVESRSGETDPEVFAAFDQLREAFLTYEDALFDTYDEVTPLEAVEADDEDLDDLDFDDEDLEDDEDLDDLDEDDENLEDDEDEGEIGDEDLDGEDLEDEED